MLSDYVKDNQHLLPEALLWSCCTIRYRNIAVNPILLNSQRETPLWNESNAIRQENTY